MAEKLVEMVLEKAVDVALGSLFEPLFESIFSYLKSFKPINDFEEQLQKLQRTHLKIQAKDLGRGYAMVLPVILGYLQTQPQHFGGDEEQARLYSQAAYLCFTIALVALTASGPLPSASKTLQFFLFLLILGCSLLLSLAAPDMLGGAPYFSCIRPFFHLLPAESEWNALAGLVAAGAIPNAQHSLPAQANLNSLQAVELCEQQVCSREASTASLASSSSSDYHLNLEWVLKHLAQLNLEQVHAHPPEYVKPL